MGTRNILDEILGKVDELPLEDQYLLAELIRNRCREKRREDILANVRQTLEEHKKASPPK